MTENKKNWFMTQNNRIIDLNRYVGFFTKDLTVYGVMERQGNVVETDMGTLYNEQALETYLEIIYGKLVDDE